MPFNLGFLPALNLVQTTSSPLSLSSSRPATPPPSTTTSTSTARRLPTLSRKPKMPPRLRVLISTGQSYPPTALCAVNSPTPTRVKNALFDGEVSVFVKGFNGEGKGGDGEVYFDARGDMTYGIVVRGRYLDNPNADDVVFGNIFEQPIRDSLPWGTAIATKFMYFIDPTLELDVYADKPWALSPALATMNHLSLSKQPVPEPTDKAVVDEDSLGVVDFNTLSVTLPRPFALSVNLLKYWDGQPVTYVCRRRAPAGQSPVTAEGVYWSVAFEIVDEDAVAELEKRGGKVLSSGKAGGDKTEPGASEGASTSKSGAVDSSEDGKNGGNALSDDID